MFLLKKTSIQLQPRVNKVEILRQYTLAKRRLGSLTSMIAFKILSDTSFFTISSVQILRSRKMFSLIVSMWWYFVLFSSCALWFSLAFWPWKQNFVNFCNVWEIENREDDLRNYRLLYFVEFPYFQWLPFLYSHGPIKSLLYCLSLSLSLSLIISIGHWRRKRGGFTVMVRNPSNGSSHSQFFSS